LQFFAGNYLARVFKELLKYLERLFLKPDLEYWRRSRKARKQERTSLLPNVG
jgi:hypothetical protein